MALAVLALVGADPGPDVSVLDTRRFVLPILVRPDRRDEILSIRLYVSTDEGRNWKIVGEFKPTDDGAPFTAPRDGSYWFALQVISRGGTADPSEVRDLRPGQKVLVKTGRQAPTVREFLENEWRRQYFEKVEKRVAEREARNREK
jgi:hypothetical protein